ncbi:MAG: hypothetical protein JWP44_4561, partial [Mucilaginibacter sp.]|nr:hypothetical protein [Mucilaginibacter sp.]
LFRGVFLTKSSCSFVFKVWSQKAPDAITRFCSVSFVLQTWRPRSVYALNEGTTRYRCPTSEGGVSRTASSENQPHEDRPRADALLFGITLKMAAYWAH